MKTNGHCEYWFVFTELADLANNYKGFLSPDKDCFYDQLIEIDLSTVLSSLNEMSIQVIICHYYQVVHQYMNNPCQIMIQHCITMKKMCFSSAGATC